MKSTTKKAQIKSIRNFQKQLREYIKIVTAEEKRRAFTMREIKDIIFHLQTISTITDEAKIAQKAKKLEKLFWKIIIFEINGSSRISEDKGRPNVRRARSKEVQPKI